MSTSQTLGTKPISKSDEDWSLLILPIIILLVDSLTPGLIAYQILPAPIRWIGDLAVLLLIGLVFLFVFAQSRLPLILIFMIWAMVLWGVLAILSGQGVLPTFWGWWVLFKFPFVALFFYLYPRLPRNIPTLLPLFCVALLILNVILQLIQYQDGVNIGDHLSGTFGRFGTGHLVIFIIFTIGLTFSWWLVKNDWKLLVLALSLGIISSVLGEMKIFPLAVAITGIIVLVIYVLRGNSLSRLLPLIIIAILTLAAFAYFFNRYAVPLSGRSTIESYLNIDQLLRYLNANNQTGLGGSFDLGRLFALQYGFNSIRRDPVTLLFGLGLGARGRSDAIGVVGSALSNSYYSNTYSSLVVMMQELGFVGLTILAVIFIWIAYRLYRDAREGPQSDLDILRYGLLLFTLLLPLWLWYASVWTMRVPMFLYWGSLGYVFNREIVSHFATRKSDDQLPDNIHDDLEPT